MKVSCCKTAFTYTCVRVTAACAWSCCLIVSLASLAVGNSQTESAAAFRFFTACETATVSWIFSGTKIRYIFWFFTGGEMGVLGSLLAFKMGLTDSLVAARLGLVPILHWLWKWVSCCFTDCETGTTYWFFTSCMQLFTSCIIEILYQLYDWNSVPAVWLKYCFNPPG